MNVILSYPFVGAFYWWIQSKGEYAMSTRPSHPYYRHLYGDVQNHLDMALAATVIFDEVYITAADSGYPNSTQKGGETTRINGLSVTADWDVLFAAQGMESDVLEDALLDPILSRILGKVPRQARPHVLRDAISDAMLVGKYRVPLICGAGRSAIINRLISIGLVTKEMLTGSPLFRLGERSIPLESHRQVASHLESYVRLSALSFRSEDVAALTKVKTDRSIRGYAEGFQTAVVQAGDSRLELADLMSEAVKSSRVASQVSGALSLTSRSLSFASLIPALAPAAVPAVVADWVSILIGQTQHQRSWYEIGPEISRFESVETLRRSLGS